MARMVIPTLHELRRTRITREQVHTFSTVLRAIALGRLPGEQRLSRQAVLSRVFAALVAAVALWVYTTEQQNPVVTHTFRLQVVPLPGTLPPDLAIRGGLPTVRVSATGLQSSFGASNTLTAYVDLSGVSANAREATVPVQLQGNVRDVRYAVTPPSVLLELEPQKSVQLTVTFNARSNLPDTLVQLGQPQIAPLLVTISGPATSVDNVANAIVAPPLDAITPPPDAGAIPFTQSFTIAPQLLDKSGNPVNDPSLTVTPSTVKVTLQLQLRYETRILTVLPLIPSLAPLPPGYVLGPKAPQPDPATILVLGSPQVLQSLPQQVVNTDPIDLSNVTHSMTVTTHIQLPAGVIAIGNNGKLDSSGGGPICKVYVTVYKQITQATLYANVTYANLGAGLMVKTSPSWISIYVRGAAVDVAHVGLLHAQLDLRDRGPGSYDLKPAVNMPITLPRYAIAPSTVHVVITAQSGTGHRAP